METDRRLLKLGIMGGTFNPIHVGHLRIAEEIREELELDRVLFVPTGVPVFKRDQDVADAEVRFAQVSAAIADNPHFEASRVEIDRPGDTFTVETLRELHAVYPEAELYFIVGSDSAATIGKWRGVAEIAELAHLAVAVGRPGSVHADELRETILAAAPFDLHLVRASALEISSSDIRRRLAEGRSVRYLVPDSLVEEVSRPDAPRSAQGVDRRASERFFPGDEGRREACAERSAERATRRVAGEMQDPLSDEFYEARKAELAKRVSKKRYKHVMGVAKTCKKLARRYGLDERKARLAGLLHDWDKGLDDEQARARVHELGLAGEIDPWIVENMPRVLHGYTAAVALGRDFPEIPEDVLQAIDRHTTAAEDMSDLDKVLYIADALEPGRKFGRIDELRAIAKTASLDELYFQTYEYWVLLLFERRQPLHPDTMRIWNANVLRWQAERKGEPTGVGPHGSKKGDGA